jgi:hypothetical protein
MFVGAFVGLCLVSQPMPNEISLWSGDFCGSCAKTTAPTKQTQNKKLKARWPGVARTRETSALQRLPLVLHFPIKVP